MRDSQHRQAVDTLARAVLSRPELARAAGVDTRAELAQFAMVSRAFHGAPRRARRRRGGRHEPLGFGVEGIAGAVTALVLAASLDALSQLAQDGISRSARGLAAWLRRVVLRRPSPSPDPGPAPASPDGEAPLTPAQARRIHRATQRHARRLGVPAATAETIADGIVAELAMGRPVPGGSASRGGASPDPGGGGERA